MDADDIFKKLSRGAKFSKRQVNVSAPSIEKPSQIKMKTEPPDEVLGNNYNPNNNNNTEDAITLLGNITTNSKRGKKRKAMLDDNELEKKRQLLIQERINQYRNENQISVVGRHVAEPAKTFDEFQIDVDLVENLKKCRYSTPTPIQKQAIPVLLEGRQVLACAPTGSGKTAAFLVPVIQSLKTPQSTGIRGLVICPTRELAKQTQRECMRLADGRNLKIHVITKIKQNVKHSYKYDILITTPNRLCFLLNQEQPAISLSKIEWLIIDEADKLFEEGVRSFKDQLNQILNSYTSEKRKISMFSATYTPAVAKWCVHNMKGLIRITIGQRNATTDLVEQELLFVGNESGKLLAFRDLIRKGLTPPVLVFVQSKERAQQLFSELIYDGINVDAIHADRTQLQRDNTVKSFREGKIWVLICTELMARGVDFKGVNLVINYDFPPSAIAYVHRIGRAGRAGRKGKAVTFFTLEDTVNLRSIAHVLKQSGCEVPNYMLYMKKQSKKEKKKLQVSAPQRDDILTVPLDERRKIDRAKGVNRIRVNKNSNKDKTGKKGQINKNKKNNKIVKGKPRVLHKKIGESRKKLKENGGKKKMKGKVKKLNK